MRIQTFTYFDIVIFWNALHIIVLILKQKLKALVVKNSVLHDFGFGKVSPAKQL